MLDLLPLTTTRYTLTTFSSRLEALFLIQNWMRERERNLASQICHHFVQYRLNQWVALSTHGRRNWTSSWSQSKIQLNSAPQLSPGTARAYRSNWTLYGNKEGRHIPKSIATCCLMFRDCAFYHTDVVNKLMVHDFWFYGSYCINWYFNSKKYLYYSI